MSFDEILEAAVIGVRPLYHSKGLYLHTDVGGGLPLIFCDATRVREVLLNLLSNAGRYTDAGGVTIKAQRAGEQLVVAVEDTGRGISPQDLGRLFQPFSQLDASLSRRNGGAGLGLSISKQFIELHEGRMWVESEVGKGTTFYFQLPITAPGPLAETAARWLEEDWEFVERPARPRISPPELRPRYLVRDANGALLGLLTRSLPSADIVPISDIAAAHRAPAEEMGDLLLVNDVSVSAGLARLNAPGGPPPLPALVCAISSPEEDPDTQGATARLVKPILRETLLTTLADAGVTSGLVLIVDDEPDALQLFSRLLTSAAPAYRVLVAGTGQEALHILRDYRPDAILLDLVMPDMDGYELLSKLQSDPTLSAAPVIIISARDPATYPLISDGLAIAYPEGVSARRVMATIEFTNRLFAPESSRAPASPIGPPG